MNYWISGIKKEQSLPVSNGITSYCFLSTQQGKWIVYGLASSRVGIIHAAIVTGLVCSKFNHLTNKLEPGLLTMEAFRNGDIKSFEDPGTTVSEHLDRIMSKDFEAPMVQDQFPLSAYIPKNDMHAAELIQAARLQSVWISNFKRQSAQTSISKFLASWFALPVSSKIHCNIPQQTQEGIRPTVHFWPMVTVCIIRKVVQPSVTRKAFK
jgi:hypothetical protein